MRILHTVVVLGLLSGAAGSAHAQRLPWKHGDTPPTLAGFRLHERPDSARARLGADVTVDTLGTSDDAALAYTSRRRGISLVTSRLDGVAIIYVTRRDAGMLDSIRVGDTRERVVRRWGNPPSTDGPNALWLVDDWVIVVELGEDKKVVRLAVGRQG
ncbi:MAG: hypothetical protein JF589_10170 [Gemmatimonadetes bacterium]|jgi:hypothetical protein|nr:hypothetical protein [Gemmatimonadota bacterium]